MEELRVQLERKKLDESFEVISQELQTSYKLPIKLFKDIEFYVNKYCKELQTFNVKVDIEVSTYLSYIKNRSTEQLFKVDLIDIVKYDGTIIFNERTKLNTK